ncbi:Late embryogenesis abundant protein, LEA-14 [Corchorus olitorius]|uniref:Late embryogenesis abundant protein, LEA-14 n=1 Tax=Corchorus olitorius TaxID=93759 RepID=A0A1R3H9H0_9ROSI|nr:Late embryogenesis abundant protein, LEA-14 [Corchorus olitorius]
MAEKSGQSAYPLAPSANGHARSDEESAGAAAHSKELKKKKRMKCLLYIVLFAVFQTGVILLFALTVMKVRNPKFRLRSDTSFPSTFDVGTETSPSFNFRMNAEFGVKNTNFGNYKYHASTITFSYRGTPVGQVTINKSQARFRSTKKVSIEVDLSSSNLSNTNELGSDIRSRVIPLTTNSKLEGNVYLMGVLKKKKNVQMNCTMEVALDTRTLQNIVCK